MESGESSWFCWVFGCSGLVLGRFKFERKGPRTGDKCCLMRPLLPGVVNQWQPTKSSACCTS